MPPPPTGHGRGGLVALHRPPGEAEHFGGGVLAEPVPAQPSRERGSAHRLLALLEGQEQLGADLQRLVAGEAQRGPFVDDLDAGRHGRVAQSREVFGPVGQALQVRLRHAAVVVAGPQPERARDLDRDGAWEAGAAGHDLPVGQAPDLGQPAQEFSACHVACIRPDTSYAASVPSTRLTLALISASRLRTWARS
jgi:hypothetical protein